MNLSATLRVLGLLEREYDLGPDTLSDRIRQARAYVDDRLYQADVVAQLPQVGKAGHLYVTPGDTNLYIGTGSGMRRVATQAVP